MVTAALIIFAVFLLIFGVVVFFDIKRAKKHQIKYTWRRTLTAFLLLLPATVLAFFFVLLPILYSLGYSFTSANLLKMDRVKWNGFTNFMKIFADKTFLRGMRNTAIFVILVVPLQIGLALGLALFCNLKMRGNTIFKVCFFAPVVVSLVITSFLWSIIFREGSGGMLNSLLINMGIIKEPIRFLTDEDNSMLWIVLVSAWQGCGYQMLIFLSGLSGIRKDLYEAARMDGCNAWQRFKKVTLPGLRPTMVFILITVFIGACRIMIQPMLMLGPDYGMTVSYYMYNVAFSDNLVGRSCAVALLMTIFIGSITFIQRKILGGKKS